MHSVPLQRAALDLVLSQPFPAGKGTQMLFVPLLWLVTEGTAKIWEIGTMDLHKNNLRKFRLRLIFFTLLENS